MGEMKQETIRRHAARKFVEQWTFRRGSEKGEDRQFWNLFLRDGRKESQNLATKPPIW